ncbi:hypothetical protein NDU88_008050 [Pleurodeles waltl]|uniref:Uncharacterized protein n=1 Tax=Pleurodeles waltl TaxID=8319 RepID=A0AAV7PR13_PLEWA|nr:hypothetical protein NDU88_008050 [Pleurodeles waltl]
MAEQGTGEHPWCIEANTLNKFVDAKGLLKAFETKINTMVIDLGLLREDQNKLAEKVCTLEAKIHELSPVMDGLDKKELQI